jgi:pectate lyase
MGLDTTTGGAAGPIVTVSSAIELESYIESSDDPFVILVDGIMNLGGSHISMRPNKTLIGLAGARIINGGLEFHGDYNIIIRNIAFDDGNIDDAIKINQDSHHIWIDHCYLSNYEDGLLDITRGSSYITISWNHFKNHDKTILIGHSDNNTGDIGRLKTTLHHNWFDSTVQRHPRVRLGEVHIYNNYFYNINAGSNASADEGYGIASANEADVLVEGNYFQDVTRPMISGVEGFSGPGDIVERFNIFDHSGDPVSRGTAFEASGYYSYELDDASAVPALIMSGAGVGKIDPQQAAMMFKD